MNKLEYKLRYVIKRAMAPIPNIDEEWNTMRMRLKDAENAERNTAVKNRRQIFLHFLSGIAASFVLLIITYGVYQYNHDGVNVFRANNATKDVLISTEQGDQKVVKDCKLDFKKAASVSKIKAGTKVEMLTLSTPRGKSFTATLPDGTIVTLNADSKITFPEAFNGKERRVQVSGEVYFCVAKDKQHPFIAETDFFNTKVTGTVFDLRAYSAKDASLTLVSGKVTLKNKSSNETLNITPDEKVIWSPNKSFELQTVDTYPITQWKDGYFYFSNDELVKIMQELGRWYNVNIVFENPKHLKIRLHFVADRNAKLQDIVKSINQIDVVKVSLDEEGITIK